MAAFAAVLEFTDDHELRVATRPVHREYLRSLLDGGKLRMSGPVADESGALIIYEAGSLDEAQSLLEADPYRAVGVIADARIREWTVVLKAENEA